MTLRDTLGKAYDYRAYQYLIIDPADVWVTEFVAGKECHRALADVYLPSPGTRRLQNNRLLLKSLAHKRPIDVYVSSIALSLAYGPFATHYLLVPGC